MSAITPKYGTFLAREEASFNNSMGILDEPIFAYALGDWKITCGAGVEILSCRVKSAAAISRVSVVKESREGEASLRAYLLKFRWE